MIRIADHETGAYQKTNEDAQERVHLVALAHTSEKHLFRQTKVLIVLIMLNIALLASFLSKNMPVSERIVVILFLGGS